MDTSRFYSDWQRSRTEIFWDETATCDHVLQIYEDDDIFIDSLAGFVVTGVNAGDSCIVVLTPTHIQQLEKKLTELGMPPEFIKGKSYYPFDAIETLDKFMVDDAPNEKLFNEMVTKVLADIGYPEKKVRASGEMVALLWDLGLKDATIELERLWNKFCKHDRFCLYCAYPKNRFTQSFNDSLSRICCEHSKIIDGSRKQLKKISYKERLM